MAMKWEEQVYQLRREWQATPCATHAIDIWEHDKEGYSWCVGTDDGADDTPDGWSATLDDAKRHAEAAYREWCLEQPNGTAQFLVQLHALEQKLAEARAEVDELRAAYAALRQASADLCVVCGWRFYVPEMGCQACERARLEAENERLRADLNALGAAVGQACVAASLSAGETLTNPTQHIIVSTVTRLRAEAMAPREQERAAVVAWLREEYDTHSTQDAADHIERGEHRREEE